MAKHALFIRATGHALAEIAPALVAEIESFLASRTWVCGELRVVDEAPASDDEGCDWVAGVQLPLPDSGADARDWFVDVQALIRLAEKLQHKFGQPFILEISDEQTGCSEVIVEIDSAGTDVEYVRRFIGAH